MSPIISRSLLVAGAVAAAAGVVKAVRSHGSAEPVAFPDAAGPPAVDTVQVGGSRQPTDAYDED